MLLDQFEEQFDLPAGLVKERNGQSWFGEVVGQKHELFSGQGIDISNPAQDVRIIPLHIKSFQDNYLIAANAETFVHGMRIPANETKFVRSALGYDAAIIGGAMLACQDVFASPENQNV
jgi:hypothetical protein